MAPASPQTNMCSPEYNASAAEEVIKHTSQMSMTGNSLRELQEAYDIFKVTGGMTWMRKMCVFDLNNSFTVDSGIVVDILKLYL